MTAKKDFKTDNPALSYISIQEPSGAVNKNEAPEGYKQNYVETKSKRVQLLLQPSTVRTIKEVAQNKGLSMNEAINEAIKEYIAKEQ